MIDFKVCHLSRVNICSSTECDPVVASDGTGEGSSLQIQHWSSLIVRTFSHGDGVAVSTAGILHGDVVEGDGGVDFPPLVLIGAHHQCWRPLVILCRKSGEISQHMLLPIRKLANLSICSPKFGWY